MFRLVFVKKSCLFVLILGICMYNCGCIQLYFCIHLLMFMYDFVCLNYFLNAYICMQVCVEVFLLCTSVTLCEASVGLLGHFQVLTSN